jgi:hypothetical protein
MLGVDDVGGLSVHIESYKPSKEEFNEEFNDASSVADEFNEPFSEVSNGNVLLFSRPLRSCSVVEVPFRIMKLSQSRDCCCRNFPCLRIAAIRLFASLFTFSSLSPFLVFFRGLAGEDLFEVPDFILTLGELFFDEYGDS